MSRTDNVSEKVSKAHNDLLHFGTIFIDSWILGKIIKQWISNPNTWPGVLSLILSYDDFHGISPEKKRPSTTVGLLFQECWVLKRRNNDFLKVLFDVFCPSVHLPSVASSECQSSLQMVHLHHRHCGTTCIFLYYYSCALRSHHPFHSVPSHAKAHRQPISSPINMFPSSDRSCPI